MPKILVVYFSRSGHTAQMAKSIEEGVREEGIELESKRVQDTNPDDLLAADGIIMGSPTYYGTMAAELKKLIDDSVRYHEQLEGKVGAAFASSGILGGGNETTVLDILKAMLIHGMIIQGDPRSSHYGSVAIGEPDDKSRAACKRLGQRVARLVKRLSATK